MLIFGTNQEFKEWLRLYIYASMKYSFIDVGAGYGGENAASRFHKAQWNGEDYKLLVSMWRVFLIRHGKSKIDEKGHDYWIVNKI